MGVRDHAEAHALKGALLELMDRKVSQLGPLAVAPRRVYGGAGVVAESNLLEDLLPGKKDEREEHHSGGRYHHTESATQAGDHHDRHNDRQDRAHGADARPRGIRAREENCRGHQPRDSPAPRAGDPEKRQRNPDGARQGEVVRMDRQSGRTRAARLHGCDVEPGDIHQSDHRARRRPDHEEVEEAIDPLRRGRNRGDHGRNQHQSDPELDQRRRVGARDQEIRRRTREHPKLEQRLVDQAGIRREDHVQHCGEHEPGAGREQERRQWNRAPSDSGLRQDGRERDYQEGIGKRSAAGPEAVPGDHENACADGDVCETIDRDSRGFSPHGAFRLGHGAGDPAPILVPSPQARPSDLSARRSASRIGH